LIAIKAVLKLEIIRQLLILEKSGTKPRI